MIHLILERTGYRVFKYHAGGGSSFLAPLAGSDWSRVYRDPGLCLADAFEHLCEHSAVYQHKKGGIYRVIGEGRLTDDKSEVVVYEHLGPHEKGIWVRAKGEFYEPGRFERLTHWGSVDLEKIK